jgi:hypothetical protein
MHYLYSPEAFSGPAYYLYPLDDAGTHGCVCDMDVDTPRLNIQDWAWRDQVVVYEAIDELYHAGFPIKQAEHPRGFPSIAIDVADLAVLTDTLSVEVWHHAHSKEHLGKEDA